MFEALKSKLDNSNIRPYSCAIERTMSLGEALGESKQIAIVESNQPLVDLSSMGVSCFEPHPHLSIGATYGEYSPYCVRQEVHERLIAAQEYLTELRPGLFLRIYDAYRPLAVQAFMIEYEFNRLVDERGFSADSIDDSSREQLMQEVLMVWAKPDKNLAGPPPHSTGAAVDVTICDSAGQIAMGSAIDAIGAVSLPNHFRESEAGELFHANRELLLHVMSHAGFQRMPHEWWHFSYGDQMWALLDQLEGKTDQATAIYGRVEV